MLLTKTRMVPYFHVLRVIGTIANVNVVEYCLHNGYEFVFYWLTLAQNTYVAIENKKVLGVCVYCIFIKLVMWLYRGPWTTLKSRSVSTLQLPLVIYLWDLWSLDLVCFTDLRFRNKKVLRTFFILINIGLKKWFLQQR